MHEGSDQWFVIHANPYPWKVPNFTVSRRKGGGFYPKAGRDLGLHTYKEAVAEQVRSQSPRMIDGEIELQFWFYRELTRYKTATGRKGKRNEADTTNMQKATEDALQGILFENDNKVVRVASWRVEQAESTTPMLIIRASPLRPMTLDYPQHVLELTKQDPPAITRRTLTHEETLDLFKAPGADETSNENSFGSGNPF